MLEHITPVLLTFNEALNIASTLSHLRWAKDIVVVDSGSNDRTLEIVARFPQARIFKRPLYTLADQWRFVVEQTGIATPWILRLDADYKVSAALVAELATLDPNADVSAYRIDFDYAIFGHKLLSSLYPSNTILLRQGRFTVANKGHTEVWLPHGAVAILKGRVTHDDWKATDAWVNNQLRYMARELERLREGHGGVANWLRRRPPLMPVAVFLYCLFGRGLIFDSKAGLFYALQRLVAEAILSLMMLEERLRRKADASSDKPDKG